MKFYAKCSGLDEHEYNLVLSKESLGWFCDACRVNAKEGGIRNLLQQILQEIAIWKKDAVNFKKHLNSQEMLKNVSDEIINLKTEIVKIQKNVSATDVPTYASAAKALNNNSVVIITPKVSQLSSITEQDIKKSLDPASLKVSGIRKGQHGKVVISCKDIENSTKLQQAALTKLDRNYDVKIPKQLLPKIKIIDIKDDISADKFVDSLRSQNEHLFEDGSTVKLMHMSKGGEESNVSYTAYLEVDGNTFKKIIENRKLNIGWSKCRVFEELKLYRRYKCWGFNHKSSNCKKEITCPKCAGEHKVSDCSSEYLKYFNCKYATEVLKIKDLEVTHEAWDRNCESYKRKLLDKQSKINYSS